MIDFLKKLIQADSTLEHGEFQVSRVIQDYFHSFGIDSRIYCWDKNRANITVRIPGHNHAPAVVFASHLDVVPAGQQQWKYPAFGAVEEDGKIYGRGATDMKGPMAAAIEAICQIVKDNVRLKGDVIFTATAGEETDGCGALKFVEEFKGKHNNFAGFILTEPTNCELITAHRGILWLSVNTKGKTAHGSMPHLGINAILSMNKFIDELTNYKINVQPHPLLGGCSMSINTISGGNAMNVVPDKCTIGIDIRTLPNQNYNEIIEDFQKIFARLNSQYPDFQAEVEIVRHAGALENDNSCSFIQNICQAVNLDKTSTAGYTTDGPFFARLGFPVVIYGPGHGEVCHKPDEYIEISDIQRGVDLYKNIILKFLT